MINILFGCSINLDVLDLLVTERVQHEGTLPVMLTPVCLPLTEQQEKELGDDTSFAWNGPILGTVKCLRSRCWER